MTIQKRPRGRPKSPFSDSNVATLQSLDRALGLLVALATAGRATLTDLSLGMKIPAATTHRILTTLQKNDFVSFDETTQEWMIGIEAYRTGSVYLHRTSLTEIGQPVMRALMEKTGETANLAVPDGAQVVFIDQVETRNPIRAFFPPGTRTAMHASGTGKAILAMLTENEVKHLLKDVSLTVFTEHTRSSSEDLFRDLAETRMRGWSFDAEERYDGMSCIGSAILDESGQPCAGISISGPSSRFSVETIAMFGNAVSEAAAEITQKLGGAPKPQAK